MAKKRTTSKTYWLSAVLVAVGTLETNMPFMKDLLGKYYGLFIVVVGILVAVLRELTSEPIENGTPEKD